MKKSALRKDSIRNIKHSLGRFLSIAAIIALGVAFFTGLKIAPEVMKATADKYYDDYNLMDIRIVSTLGLTNDDADEIRRIEGVDKVFPTYTIDALAEYDGREVVLRIHGLSEPGGVNDVKLIEGRLPEAPNECVVEKGKSDSISIPIGSTISLTSGKDEPLSDDLENTELKLVGFVQTPNYLSFEKGSSSIGNGQVRAVIMVDQENFKLPVYTDIYLTVEGAKGVNSYGDDYFPIIDKVTERLEDLAEEREVIRYREIVDEARQELDEGKAEYFQEKKDVEEKLAKALVEIEDGKEELAKGERELQRQEREFYKTISEGKDQLAKAEADLLKGEKEYRDGLHAFEDNKAKAEEGFNLAEIEIAKGEEAIIQLEETIGQMNMALENPQLPDEERQRLTIELEAMTKILAETKESVEVGKKEVEMGRLELAKVEEELTKSKDLLDSSRQTLEEEKNKLLEGERQGLREINQAKEDLQKAREDLLKGEEEYLEAKEEAEREFEKAWKEIQDGEKEIEDIEEGQWYVLDRNSHYSYMDYGGAADRIDAIGKVFPVFFALVAVLVCLTTMTRMVDEQRVNIGTMKALGYGRGAIASKYIFYAFAATLIGCIIGISIGFTLFPSVIFDAYGMMYSLPPVILRFNTPLALATSIVAIGLTTFTTFLACSNELREVTAALLRPRAPKAGKRILLERIPIIWNRFNFSGKVTIRNTFRYKRRFFMTVLGVAGCTALILTAFGVKDSIRTVVDTQFGQLFDYDMTLGLDPKGIQDLEDERIEGYRLLNRESGKLTFDSMTKDISITVPENLDTINSYIHLRNRKTGDLVHMPEDGVVITEQVSRSLGVKVGDEIILRNSDEEETIVEVHGITENYLSNYVYLSKDYYEEIFKREVDFNEAIARLVDTSEDFEDQLSRDLIRKEGINNISFNTSIRENFGDTINSLNYVVFVMIFSAGALAFVVLYNLTNVNISERIREIATIKVLGFYDIEVASYIYRENTVLTLIGTMVGLIFGVFLHRFIMTTVEMDNLMFGLKLDPKSYLISIGLTLGFAIFVNLAMYYKLRNIEMVESLKSID